MTRKVRSIRVVCLTILALATPTLAQIPLGTGFTYQGEVRQDGAPVDGRVHLRFSLWDSEGSGQPPVGGNQIGASQLLSNVPVTGGLFSVILNASGEFSVTPFTGEERWLQIEVCGDPSCQSLTILSPRQPVTAAPYSLFSMTTPWTGIAGIPPGFADGVDNIGEITWEASGTNIYRATGNVGIGTVTPEVKLHLSGSESRLRLESASSGSFAVTEYQTDSKRWSVGVGGSTVQPELAGKYFVLDETPGASPQSLVVVDGGNVGIRTPFPAAPLHVTGGSAATSQGGGTMIIGGDQNHNLGFDEDSIMARQGNTPWPLRLNEGGGDVLIARGGPGRLGIDTDSPLGGVHVHKEPATFGGTLTLEGDTHTYMSFYPDGVAAGRGGWFGYGGSFDNNLYIVNGLNNIIADPGGGDAFHIRGFLLVDNMAFGDYHNVQWNSDNAQFYYDDSTRRHKENIEPLEDDFERLLDAQPMTYTRPGKPERWEIGYIAEDIEDLGLTHLLQYDKEGEPEGVNYEKAVLYLTEIAKAQRDRIAEQATRLAEQQAQLAQQEKQMNDLTERIDRLEAIGKVSANTTQEAIP